MEILEIIKRMLFNSYPVTAFLQEIIDSECIVLLIQFDKGQRGCPREEEVVVSGICYLEF